MNAVLPAPDRWSRPRWIFYVLLAFAAHVGLIFAFGNRKPVVPREVIHPPTLQLTTRRSELQTLADPTIFAVPHPLGFAAASWLELPRIDFTPFRWSEPAQLLTLNVEHLGDTFLNYAQTNKVARLTFETLPPPQTTLLETAEPTTTLKQHSTVRVGGGLTDRRWLNTPVFLQSWPAPDLLTNSIVRVLADANGQIISGVLIPPGSGSKPADQQALEIARSARFTPTGPNADKLAIGSIIFEWHTVPLPDTNAPAPNP
jgi:hypothetical protein